jgi:predicted ATPase
MIRRVRLEHFKRFANQEFELENHLVLAGPNNSGKSTLIQAISVWQLALRKWVQDRGTTTKAKERSGIPITRKDFTAIPLREMNLLWTNTSTSYSSKEAGKKPGSPKLLRITVEGEERGVAWSLGFEYRYQSSEQIYIKPTGEGAEQLPAGALGVQVVHVPPFSGIGAEETRYDRPFQDLLIGQGKPGDILRNLLLEVYQLESGNKVKGKPWTKLVSLVEELFASKLLAPEYEGRPYIVCEYLPGLPREKKGDGGLPRLDIACAGSGFHQVLLLLAFFFARPSSVLLLDEPDAHLHVVLQRQIYERLKSIAADRGCQLLVATHSEVLIDATSPSRIESFFDKPHRLVEDHERDQVRQALKLLTATELLLAERGNGVLYVEGDTDVSLLTAWARVLQHPLLPWLESRALICRLRLSQPKAARDHFFSLRGVKPAIRGFLLLDSDNKGLADKEVTSQGLQIGRWPRYEAETYLFHPETLLRFVSRQHGGEGKPDFIAANYVERARKYLNENFAPAQLQKPLADHIIYRDL